MTSTANDGTTSLSAERRGSSDFHERGTWGGQSLLDALKGFSAPLWIRRSPEIVKNVGNAQSLRVRIFSLITAGSIKPLLAGPPHDPGCTRYRPCTAWLVQCERLRRRAFHDRESAS